MSVGLLILLGFCGQIFNKLIAQSVEETEKFMNQVKRETKVKRETLHVMDFAAHSKITLLLTIFIPIDKTSVQAKI